MQTAKQNANCKKVLSCRSPCQISSDVRARACVPELRTGARKHLPRMARHAGLLCLLAGLALAGADAADPHVAPKSMENPPWMQPAGTKFPYTGLENDLKVQQLEPDERGCMGGRRSRVARSKLARFSAVR
jgi:hypothetical protein